MTPGTPTISRHRRLYQHRGVVSVGFDVGPVAYVRFGEIEHNSPNDALADDFDSFLAAYGGGRLTAYLNIAPAPAIDFRFGLFGAGGGSGAGGVVPIGAGVLMRMNLRSIYTIVVGFEGGMYLMDKLIDQRYCSVFESDDPTDTCSEVKIGPGPFIGPRISFLSFNFGSKGEFAIELITGLDFVFEDHETDQYEGTGQDFTSDDGSVNTWLNNRLSFSYLFGGVE